MESGSCPSTCSLQVIYAKAIRTESPDLRDGKRDVHASHSFSVRTHVRTYAGKERAEVATPQRVSVTASPGELVQYVYLEPEVVIMI